MCNKSDNSCREEKLGCKGCKYYNVEVLQSTIESLKGHKNFIYTNEDKIKHYVQIINKLYKENRELKEITNNYDVICKNDADYILIANKGYFDNGIFKDKFILKEQLKNKIKEIYNLPVSTNEERDEHLYAMEVLNELLEY